jgi:hypothetical protein
VLEKIEALALNARPEGCKKIGGATCGGFEPVITEWSIRSTTRAVRSISQLSGIGGKSTDKFLFRGLRPMLGFLNQSSQSNTLTLWFFQEGRK